jgi:adenine-specific DNA-methyltransferase
MQVSFAFDLNHPYLKKQLIAYIGNKRALQPLLYRVFCGIREGGSGRGAGTFLDPFAGSGSVARLARMMGFRVLANDWEHYAYVLNYAHLCVGRSEAAGLFPSRGGVQGIIEELNRLPDPPDRLQYIARYYAPASTKKADYRCERLFYTRENALRIDAVRSRIEELYPEPRSARPAGEPDRGGRRWHGPGRKEKPLLLASLLYQSATHTNTSGVFKACHKGFGGHNRDALGRILAPIRLEVPVLVDAALEAEVCRQDASEFVRSRPAEICYLDPPYNQHQYGSNYHLLNSIALWDKPAVDGALGPDGRLRHKAGIRRDWVDTRSAYCYRHSASGAFRRLLEAIDARHVVLSYNTEGIIPFEELVDLLASQGRVELFSNEYVKYRGGRQSIARQVHNLEIVLVLDRSRRASRADRARIERAVLGNRLMMMLKRSFNPASIRRNFSLEPSAAAYLPLVLGERVHHLPMPHLYRFAAEAPLLLSSGGLLKAATGEQLRKAAEGLAACECRDRQEEVAVLLGILGTDGRASSTGQAPAAGKRGDACESGAGKVASGVEAAPAATLSAGERSGLERRVLWLLRKFAHRKYSEQFERTAAELRAVVGRAPARFPILSAGLGEVEALARARFHG